MRFLATRLPAPSVSTNDERRFAGMEPTLSTEVSTAVENVQKAGIGRPHRRGFLLKVGIIGFSVRSEGTPRAPSL